VYAALDVDVLVDLRDQVYALLESAGKLTWAQQDFAQILANYLPGTEKENRPDRWRRTSGIHKVRDRRTLAIIKALWEARDQFAAKVDIAPGRIFNDEALIATALAKPKTLDEMRRILTRRTRQQNLPLTDWFESIRSAIALSAEELPDLKVKSTSLPPPKIWKDRNPAGYARLTHARAAIIAKAGELEIPVENLLSPDALRKLCWSNPPDGFGTTYIEESLADSGARPWQVAATAPALMEPLTQTEPLALPEPEPESAAASEGLE
jgi:ribonuclease D